MKLDLRFVLLSAPEGSGKSCFFRALAGIWPDAEGEVFLPPEVLFIPQKRLGVLAFPTISRRFSRIP